MSRPGIRCIEDLRTRSQVEPATQCWRYLTPTGRPILCLWYGPLREYLSIGQVIAHLVTGALPEPGQVWHRTCTTKGCVNPAHRICGDRSSQMLSACLTRSAVTRARIAKARRAQSKLSQEAARAVRVEQGTLAEIGARHGVSPSCASKIRRGQQRAELAAPASSVFSWRPT